MSEIKLRTYKFSGNSLAEVGSRMGCMFVFGLQGLQKEGGGLNFQKGGFETLWDTLNQNWAKGNFLNSSV